MFGFSNISNLRYRSFYAWLCRQHKNFYGNTSRLFHSYDSALLAMLAADADLFDASGLPMVQCCRFRGSPKTASEAEVMVAKFCTSSTMLLLSVKIEDDMRDSTGMERRRARFMNRWFQPRFEKMREYFHVYSPGFLDRIHELLGQHHEMEDAGLGERPLSNYANPTSDAFGDLFAALPRLLGAAKQERLFSELGRDFGRAMLWFDCACDSKDDEDRGRFNPIKGEANIRMAFLKSEEALRSMAQKASYAFGDNIASVQAVQELAERVAARAEGRSCRCVPVYSQEGESPVGVLNETTRRCVGDEPNRVTLHLCPCVCLLPFCCGCTSCDPATCGTQGLPRSDIRSSYYR